MKKTRLYMLVGVIMLTLALGGMALAADNAQKPNPPVQVAFTGLPPDSGGVQNIANSGVNFIDPDSISPAGFTGDLCFNVHIESPDAEYMDGFDFNLPDDWVVNSVTDVPGDGCLLGHTFGVTTGNLVYWYTDGMPSGCGEWYYGDKNFCANVTIPAGCSASWELPWNYYGDTFGSIPHSTSGSELAFCELPGVYLIPDNLEAAGCNGVPQVHEFALFNNTGADGTFDMTYTAPIGMADLTGPATVSALYGETVPFEVTLTPNVCNFDPIVATIDTAGNGYEDTATITKEIVNVPSFETVPASAPTWAGTAYPRDGCTAMNSDGDWVSYQIGDMSSYTGFWGYNTDTNTWYQPAPSNLPADRWAPDWAYDPSTNLCYVTGGASAPGGGNLTDSYVFDPVANTFTQLGNFTSMRAFHTSWVGVIDGTEYLCLGGGVNASSIMVQSTQCYDLAQAAPGVWNAENAQIPALPTDPFGAADGVLHASTGDQFWFVGGAIQAGAILTDEARYFDDADNAWHQAGNTGFPRYRVEGDFFDGDFYQIGGSSGGFTPTSEVVQGHFDGVSWVWTLMDNLAHTRMDNVMGVTDSSIWSIDGYGSSSADYVEHAVFCPLCTGPLQAEKAATPIILPGDPIDYSITINNTSDADVAAAMVDAIPAGTTFVPGSLTCDTGTCSYDAGLNSVLWDGTLAGALAEGSGSNVDSLTGSYVAFDPTLGGATCRTPDTAQTFCYRAESFSPDFEYVYNLWLKFPTDWTVSNAYVVGTPVCDNGTWGSFSWSFETSPYEININHARYQGSGGAHCIATYCVDVTTGDTASTSWYWDGDGYASPPHNPCSVDGYTPASMGGQPCDEAVNPLAVIPSCGPSSAVTIDFQVDTTGLSCPLVVTNVAQVSSEGNPDVFATADTNVYCTLEPDIVVSPLSLLAEQPPDTITTQQLQICNEGPSPLDWSLTEVAGMKVTSVSPAPTTLKPSAINQPANLTKDPAINYIPNQPTDILVDQAPNAVNGLFSDSTCALCPTGQQSIADNFILDADSTLTGMVLWSGYYPTDTPMNPDVIRVLFHQDSGGFPGAVIYDENNVSYTREQTGVILFGVHEWKHTLTFASPVNLSAGVYWVEMFANAAPDDFFWETGNQDPVHGIFDSAWAQETPGALWMSNGGYDLAMQIIGTQGPIVGIPWLTEAPTSGTVDAFACVFVNVSFDSAGLAPATYTGVLDVNSNDPDTPVVPVDVTLTVQAAPDITVDPLFLEATLLPNTQETQDLNVCNVGETNLDWSLTEVPGLKVNSVTPADQPTSNPPRQVALSLDANNIAGPTAPAIVVPNADVSLILDDGSRDNDIGIGGTLEFLWVNRFTPAPDEFPFTLNQIQIYFSSVGLVNVGDNIILVVYENTSGNNDPAVGGNFLASFPTTVQALDTWNVYDLPTGVDFNGPGDAIVGVIGLEVPGSSYWPASIDQTVTQARSWAGWWNASPPPNPPVLPPDNTWLLIDAAGFPGNWMVRGFGTTGADAIPWLSEAPTSGTLGPDECTLINVTFDSTDLIPGTYDGSLDIASNDPDEPEVIVPVTLNVVVPDIVVTPAALDLELFPNETGTLPFTIENIGGAPLTWSATEGVTWLSLLPTSGTLLPGESVDIVATFDSAELIPDVYETDIDIASDDPDTPEVLLPTTLTVNPLDADLAIEKSATIGDIRVGDTFTYTIEVSNLGLQDAIGVMVVDTLPDLVTFVSASTGCVEAAGVVTCDVGALAAEESVTLTIVVTAEIDGLAENTAVVSSEFVLDPDLTNNTSSVDTEINPAMFFFYLPIVQKH